MPPANSISTCCRCRGRRPSARRRPSAAIAGVRSRPSAAAGRSPSWSTACGRNMSAAFPNYCQRPSPRLERNIMTSMLDLMPAPGLIFSEWDKHGTCSGLGARAYFETIRKARAAVKIPEEFLELVGAEDDRARRDRGGLHQGQSGPEQFGDLGDLRQPAAQRSADLHEQGSAIPRLRGDRPPRLPPRRGGDAADAGRVDLGHAATHPVVIAGAYAGKPGMTRRLLSRRLRCRNPSSMNYRHAFHAGGFADVIKHIVLVRMLTYLQEKPAAFRVIDTHAGAGRLRSHRRGSAPRRRMAHRHRAGDAGAVLGKRRCR